MPLLISVGVSTMWPSVFLKDLGAPSYLVYLVLACYFSLFILSLIAFSHFAKNEKVRRFIWRASLAASLVGWGYLSLADLSQAGVAEVVALCLSGGTISLLTKKLSGHVTGSVQQAHYGAVYLSLLMIAQTLLGMAGTSITGVLAEESYNWVAALCFICVLFSALFTKGFLPEVEHSAGTKIWDITECKHRLALYILNALHLMFGTPVSRVVIPLYFYEKSAGDVSEVGKWFALLVLFSLFADVLRRAMKNIEIPTFSTMVWAINLSYVGYFFWAIFYDNVWVAVGAVLLSYACTPPWSYGYLAELHKLDKKNSVFNVHQLNFINSLTVVFFMMILFLCDYLGWMPELKSGFLMFYALSGLAFTTAFVWWWKRNPIDKSA